MLMKYLHINDFTHKKSRRMAIEHWDCAVTDHFKKATQVYIFM